MEHLFDLKERAQDSNFRFETEVLSFLSTWVENHKDEMLLQFDQPLDIYLPNDALRDFFLHVQHPMELLLGNSIIAAHLGRPEHSVYFDPISGDPMFSPIEQRIYNLARRMDSLEVNIPFRSVHPNKQTDAGDVAPINSYPQNCDEVRYNSGNHFASRPANGNVFEEHSKYYSAKSESSLQVLFKPGFLEERLLELKEETANMHRSGETQLQYFVICSRHSLQEGHFGSSLVVMDPKFPDFPKRVLVCDTLLKQLPQHPRWWNHFVTAYSNIFGDAIAEIIEDLSHPLQKVNIKGDDPYRHDWDCPYYAASMTAALIDLVKNQEQTLLSGDAVHIHFAMQDVMKEYYHKSGEIKDRSEIRMVNLKKRWQSGLGVVHNLVINKGAIV